MSTIDGPSRAKGVQSVHRAFDLIETIHGSGELGVSELEAVAGLPVPTTRRLLQTLAERGYVRQLSNRRYTLGLRLVPLAVLASATVGAGAESILAELAADLGETANLAVLSGDRAQYVALAPSPHQMGMFTEIGRLVDLRSTGVGKALLAQLSPTRVARIARVGLPAHTEFTLTSASALALVLDEIRQRGYALDDHEHEIGVRCLTVALPGDLTWMALSISGPTTRVTDELIHHAVPLLQAAARRIAVHVSSIRPT